MVRKYELLKRIDQLLPAIGILLQQLRHRLRLGVRGARTNPRHNEGRK